MEGDGIDEGSPAESQDAVQEIPPERAGIGRVKFVVGKPVHGQPAHPDHGLRVSPAERLAERLEKSNIGLGSIAETAAEVTAVEAIGVVGLVGDFPVVDPIGLRGTPGDGLQGLCQPGQLVGQDRSAGDRPQTVAGDGPGWRIANGDHRWRGNPSRPHVLELLVEIAPVVGPGLRLDVLPDQRQAQHHRPQGAGLV